MRGFLSGTCQVGAASLADKPRVPTPVLDDPPGTYPLDDYTGLKPVTITCSQTDAVIYITNNGTLPNPSNYVLAVRANVVVGVGVNQTIKAVAVLGGYNESLVVGGLYDSPSTPKCSTPSFSPVAGSYNNDQFPKSVAITSATSGSTIHYTTDGTTPTGASPSVANGGSVSVAANQTLKAIATKATYDDSAVKSGLYTAVVYTCNTPTFSPVAGSYGDSQFPKTVTITSTFPAGLSIRYTTNGSTPSTTVGTLIASGGTASVTAGATLKAIAYKTAYNNSAVASGLYSAVSIANPTFTPNGASLLNDQTQNVTIATATAGCTIRWTKDGTTPTSTHGTLINASSGTASFTGHNTNITLKAIAMKSGYNTTPVQTSQIYEFSISGGGG